MYRAPSPFAPDNHYHPQPYNPPAGGQIVPGAVTYTTSTGPDGRIIYHPFKAVAASYQTPAGVVSGIQWVPAEATPVLPVGAQPATSDFAASWNRGQAKKDEQKALKEWQRDEEKRRKKEEKESKRLREKELGGTDADRELRKARERDAQTRERRKSFNQGASGAPGAVAFPTPVGSGNSGYAGYPAYGSATASSDLERQLANLDLDRNRGYDGERDGQISGLGRPRKYSTNESAAERARKISGNLGGPNVYNAPGTYPSPYSNTRPYPPMPGNASPYPTAGPPFPTSSPGMRPGEGPYGSAGSSPYPSYTYPTTAPGVVGGVEPFPSVPYASAGAMSSQGYPRSHALEVQGMTPRSRAASPMPGAIGGPGAGVGTVSFPQPAIPNASPNLSSTNTFSGETQLAAPEGFSRPINAAHSFTPFQTMKIQDMDEFLSHIPRMPLVLQPHDVYHEDWIRLMQDISLAWAGKLPVPDLTRGGRAPRRATLTADLIDLWNVSFFLRRGVEVVLYKGRERRSGPHAGLVDNQLPAYHDTDTLSSSSSSDDTESELEDRYNNPAAYGVYGRQNFGQGQTSMSEVLDARRRRREIKAEKKRRRKEKKIRRKAKDREKKYALYLTCVPEGGPSGAGATIPVYGGSASAYGGTPNKVGVGLPTY